MKPLDFVKTPLGSIALITEMNINKGGNNNDIKSYSISFLGEKNPGEKNAWWYEHEGLQVIDNLPSLLARNLVHPFGTGKEVALQVFPIK